MRRLRPVSLSESRAAEIVGIRARCVLGLPAFLTSNAIKTDAVARVIL
jgi:hypothetical protein